MTVKSKRGRRRYTAFEVPAGTDRGLAASAASRVRSAKVISCDGGYAVIRSLPEERGALEDAVSSAIPGSRAVDCSGTLRALRSRNPRLKVPSKRRRRFGQHPERLPKRFILPPISRRVRD